MGKKSLGKKLASLLPTEPDQDEKMRARRELGIESLAEGESLMNTATFSRVHIEAVLEGGRTLAQEPVDELILDELATEPPTDRQRRRSDSGQPTDPVEVAVLEREMMSAKSRDEVADLALRIATYYARAAALFVVHRGIVTGLRSAGDADATGIEAVMIPDNVESVLCRPIETGKSARGLAPFGEVDQRVLRVMGRDETKEMLVLPVPLGGRTVNVLYADNGQETLPDTGVGALRVLALGIAEAYERLIQERKAGAVEKPRDS